MRDVVTSVAVLTVASVASAQVLYGVDITDSQTTDATLIQIDLSTGVGTAITDIAGVNSVAGLAFDQQSGTLYGGSGTLDQVLEIDLLTGQTTVISNFGALGTAGMTFDAATGLLLAIDGATDALFSIDPSDGSINTIGSTGFSQIFGLTIDPATRTLYGIDIFNDQLVAIDADTASASVISTFDADVVSGLAFDEVTQSLFATVNIDGPAGTLISIDPTTGQSITIGSIGFGSVQGLAFIPGPGAAGVMVMGGLLAARRRR